MGRTLQRDRIRVRLATAAAFAGVGAAVLVGCSSTDTAGTSDTTGTTAAPRLVDVETFADIAADDGTFVLNVHVPDEGAIAGTDGGMRAWAADGRELLPPAS